MSDFYSSLIDENCSLSALISDLERFIEVPYWNDIDFNQSKRLQHSYLKGLLSNLYNLESTKPNDFKNSLVLHKNQITEYQLLKEQLEEITLDYNASAYAPVYEDFPFISRLLYNLRTLINDTNQHKKNLQGYSINPSTSTPPTPTHITDPSK